MNGSGGRRVAVTGVGLVSCLGRSYDEVMRALRAGRSGVRAMPEWARLGVRSLVAGTPGDAAALRRSAAIPKELLFGMSDAALYCALSAQDAVRDAGLTAEALVSPRVACIVGNGSFAMATSGYEVAGMAMAGQSRRIPPYVVLQYMSSSASAAVTNLLQVLGPSYSIAAACATSAHNIGHACMLVRAGVVDVAIAGGGEEVDGLIAAAFEGMRNALSSGSNDKPEQACRPFCVRRDGVVLGGGGGIVVLESLGHARARGARVRAELVGYGASSDGHGLYAPRPDGAQAAGCMQAAIADAGLEPDDIDYLNAHATATPAGDRAEVQAMRIVFGERLPAVSSTKAMTGHALAAAGVLEMIYCIGMLEGGFLAPSINIDRLDPAFEDLPVVREASDRAPTTVLSNSFGFGGTNASLVLRRASPN